MHKHAIIEHKAFSWLLKEEAWYQSTIKFTVVWRYKTKSHNRKQHKKHTMRLVVF